MRARLLALAAAAPLGLTAPALAQEDGLDFGIAYTADTVSTLTGGSDSKARYLGNLDLTADADLDTLIGADGLHVHIHVLQNHGKSPSNGIETLQGVNNIEVPYNGTRLFEAWVEKDFGSESLLVGLYDLNGEFYASDSAGLLIAPPFGIGSELAATGPNGPSIFPSTTLGARLNIDFGKDGENGYFRAAVLNAEASTLGDHGGVDFSFHEGLLFIAEGGFAIGEELTLAGGIWGYSDKRPHLFETDSFGDPLEDTSWGGYVMLEGRVWGDDNGGARFFLRGGISDPNTTPYSHGAQAGLLLEPALSARPDSAFSLGVHYAGTNKGYDDLVRSVAGKPANHETTIEVTYADKLAPWLMLQPDLQVVFHPGGLADADTALVATMRVGIEF